MPFGSLYNIKFQKKTDSLKQILGAGHTQSMIRTTIIYYYVFKFFEILCYRDCRKAFIWHSPRESRLFQSSENEGYMNAKKVFLYDMICDIFNDINFANLVPVIIIRPKYSFQFC